MSENKLSVKEEVDNCGPEVKFEVALMYGCLGKCNENLVLDHNYYVGK